MCVVFWGGGIVLFCFVLNFAPRLVSLRRLPWIQGWAIIHMLIRIHDREAENFFRINVWTLFHIQVTKLQLVINPKKMPWYLSIFLSWEKIHTSHDLLIDAKVPFILISSNNYMLSGSSCDTCSLPFRSFMQKKRKCTDLHWLPMGVLQARVFFFTPLRVEQDLTENGISKELLPFHWPIRFPE